MGKNIGLVAQFRDISMQHHTMLLPCPDTVQQDCNFVAFGLAATAHNGFGRQPEQTCLPLLEVATPVTVFHLTLSRTALDVKQSSLRF